MATIRQKKAFKTVVEGSTLKGAMLEAGYAETTANRTNKLTRTKGWAELMDKYMPEDLLAKKHKEMLNKSEKMIVSDGNQSGSHIEDTGQPHSDVNRALEMAYKLRGSFPKEDEGGNKTLIVMITGETAQRYASIPQLSKDSSN